MLSARIVGRRSSVFDEIANVAMNVGRRLIRKSQCVTVHKKNPEIRVGQGSGSGQFPDDVPKEARRLRDGMLRLKILPLLPKACQLCGWNAFPELLQVHHRNQNPTDDVLENLRAVCPTCHCWVHYAIKRCVRRGEKYTQALCAREYDKVEAEVKSRNEAGTPGTPGQSEPKVDGNIDQGQRIVAGEESPISHHEAATPESDVGFE